MQASTDLLSALCNKLKSANVRSPFLNSIVGRSRNKVDLHSLNLMLSDGASAFLEALLNPQTQGKVSVQIDASKIDLSKTNTETRFLIDVLLKRFQTLYFEQQSDFAEQGTHSFGFGYPVLAFTSQLDKTRIITAPLLIWSMKIQPLEHNHHAYLLQRNPGDSVILNPQLVNYLIQDSGVRLEGIPEDFLEDEFLSEEEVKEIMARVSRLFPAEETGFNGAPEPLQDKSYYARWCAEKSLWLNAGVFALFKSSKESIIADYEAMINGKDDLLFEDSTLYRPYQDYFFSSVSLDPSQEGILRNISDHKKVIIQGPPGTGKSNSLTGIIINALENKAKVLVVCEKKTALDVILENLKEKGLDDLCVVVDDIHTDRQSLVKRMRENLDQRNYEQGSSSGLYSYKHSKEEHKAVYERALIAYGNLLEDVLGDMNWKECIGAFLRSVRASGNTALLPLSTEGFSLDAEEFYSILKTIEDSAWRMAQAASLIPVFDSVQPSLLSNEWTTSDFQAWNTRLQNHHQNLVQLKEDWERFIAQHPHPDAFIRPGSAMRIKSVFSSSLKASLQEAEQLIKKTRSQLQELSNDFKLKDQEEHNAKSKAEFLRELHDELSKMIAHRNGFRDYKNWRAFELLQPQKVRRLIDVLKARPTEEWVVSFRAWYLNAMLMKKEEVLRDFPTDSRNLEQLMAMEANMGDSQLVNIRDIWHAQQREQMEGKTLQQMRLLFNLRGNKSFGSRNSLRTLFHEQFDLLTSFFPVLLINPSVCSAMLPLKAGLFDLVVFDEASQLRLEDTFPALLRGRFKIISGDIHQMPPATHFSASSNADTPIEDLEDDVVFSEEESLLTYAQNADFEFNYLDFHYRSRHPLLIAFSNAAFYGQRLVAMPPTIHHKPIEMREVNGLYTQNTNVGEADEILKILFSELSPNPNGKWPSIGIATLNMTQQRFLWEKIWEYTETDEAARSKLALFESNGFFIKNLENIQGDQRDIIILSTTFGRKEDGGFLQNFGPLNRDKGYKMLNVIVTRARDKIILVTSIPREYYMNFRDDLITKGNTGKGIFYAYLNFARFCSEGNDTARDELLSFLQENQKEASVAPTSASNFLTESVFEEEVLEDLLTVIPKNLVMTQFQLGGFRLDIVILNESGEPQMVIECDGKKYHKSKVAHRYDIHRQNILEQYGLTVYRIWSTNWWRDREGEFLKLRNEIKFICNL
jgi:very-short-patch-repair endonuclease